MYSSSWGFITFYFSRFKDFFCSFFSKDNILLSHDCQCHFFFLSTCCFHLNSLIKSNCGLHCLRVLPGRTEYQVWLLPIVVLDPQHPRVLYGLHHQNLYPNLTTWPSFSQEVSDWTLSCFAVTVTRDRNHRSLK